MSTRKYQPTKIDVLDGDWTTEEVLRSVRSHEELVSFAKNFHGDWKGNGQNHQPLERIGKCWCCDMIARAEGAVS
jgi:hypothetical protein